MKFSRLHYGIYETGIQPWLSAGHPNASSVPQEGSVDTGMEEHETVVFQKRKKKSFLVVS